MGTHKPAPETMAEAETLNRLRELVGRVSMVDPASISGDAQLLGFGIDSIRVVDLVMTIEEEFAIQLHPPDFADLTTVMDLAALIDRVRRVAAVPAQTHPDH
jgi:acyl carrier protein